MSTAARVVPAQPRPAPGAWLLYAAFLPVAAAIAGFGATYSAVWVPVTVLLFVECAALIWLQALGRNPVVWSPAYVPMTGWFGLVAAQWAFHWSVYRGVTLTGLIQLAGCGCLFFLALHACAARSRAQRLAWMLWLLCGALSLEALFQSFSANGYIYWFHDARYASPIGPFVYHNHFAGCMELLLPVAAAVALRGERSVEAPWLLAFRRSLFPLLGLAAMVVALSRGGAIVISFQALLALAVFAPEWRHRARELGLVAALIVLLLFAMTNLGPLVQRISRLQTHSVGLDSRLQVARACLTIFEQHPWVGTGFNTFATVYPVYQRFDNGLIWLQAHDDYAQMLAETGVAGLVMTLGFLAVLLGAAWQCWRRRSREQSPPNLRRLRLAAFVALSGFLVHSLGDFEFHAPANALLFFLVCALLLAPPPPTSATLAVPPARSRREGR